MAKRSKGKIDTWLLFTVLTIVLIGFLMLYSVSAQKSLEYQGHTYYFLFHQLIFGVLPGMVLGFLALKMGLDKIRRVALYLFIFNLLLLVLVFIPQIGPLKGGARRWLEIGSFSFQPAELLKITLPVYLAAWLSARKKKNLTTLATFFLILTPVVLILIFQPDFSTLSLLLSIAGLLYFLAKTPLWHSFLMVAIAVAGSLSLIVFKSYRLERFLVFLNPEIDPLGMGYQLKQCLIAIGSGGFWGKGLGLSRQKFGLLPNVVSDSIFAAYAEETGFIGPLILISLFLFFLARVLIIARKNRNSFAGVLAFVLGAEIVLQAFLNMAAMLAVIPLTGTPLSFISYGGTHLVVELTMVGILLNISKS